MEQQDLLNKLKLRKKDHPDKVATVGYGLTETNAHATNASGITLYERPSTAGYPTPVLNFIKIMDEEGNELGPNELGEVAIKSTCNFRCYLKNEEATMKYWIVRVGLEVVMLELLMRMVSFILKTESKI